MTSPDNAKVLPVIIEVTRKLRAILDASPYDSLYAKDVAVVSQEVISSFPEQERVEAAVTLIVVIQGLIADDVPTRELTSDGLANIQAEMLLATIERSL